MTKRTREDEELLLDFLAGQCDGPAARRVNERLGNDEAFRRHHDDMAAAIRAVKLLVPVEPPAGLVDDTMARIRQRHRTDALVAREGLRRRRRVSGLPVREIIAVAASLALLASVLVPFFRQTVRLSTAEQCAAQIEQIGKAMAAYADANNQYLPVAGASHAGATPHWLPSETRPGVSNSEGLFKLVSAGLATQSLFQCPAAQNDEPKTFTMTAGMIDFPQDRFVNYSYQHTLAPSSIRRSDPTLAAVADSMAILADATPVFQAGRFRPDRVEAKAGDNHSGQGQNVLYLDMHVQWSHDAAAGVMGDNIYLVEGIDTYSGDEAPAGPRDSFLLPAYSRRR